MTHKPDLALTPQEVDRVLHAQSDEFRLLSELGRLRLEEAQLLEQAAKAVSRRVEIEVEVTMSHDLDPSVYGPDVSTGELVVKSQMIGLMDLMETGESPSREDEHLERRAQIEREASSSVTVRDAPEGEHDEDT